MDALLPHPVHQPVRILFVLGGGSGAGPSHEARIRRLAMHLDPMQWRVEFVPGLQARDDNELRLRRLERSALAPDWPGSEDERAEIEAHLAERMAMQDLVVVFDPAPSLQAARARLTSPPPMIDGMEALAQPADAPQPRHELDWRDPGPPPAPPHETGPALEARLQRKLAEGHAAPPRLFRSFMQGGFECSTHHLRSGRRVDVIAATGHAAHAESDYRQLARMGLRTVRDGARWHLIERQPRRHDLSSWLPMARAAQATGTQVIWDLMHYGWPDDLDIWSAAFVDRLAALARTMALAWRDMTDEVPFWCPVNEISFFSWAGGDVAYMRPFAEGRGFELKVQLARAAIAAGQAVRDVDPRARLVYCEPLIAVHHDPATGHNEADARGYHNAQYQALDLISGRLWPQIGGEPGLLDIVGANYYHNNQWIHGGGKIDRDHPAYRPLADLLTELHLRYERPVFLAETGIEGDARAPWLRYVANEVARARRRGVPVEGICLYPVMNHPGWDDDRPCPNGLLTQEFRGGQRGVEPALAAEVARQVRAYALPAAEDDRAPRRPTDRRQDRTAAE
jgi:hypothetical protein